MAESTTPFTGVASLVGDRLTIHDQTFTTQALLDAGRLLGVLGEDWQERAIKSLRDGDFEAAKEQQRIADILRNCDFEAWLNQHGIRS